MVDSVCRRNLARPCQVDSSKRSFRTISSCFFGKSPSKTGIAHLYYTVSIFDKGCKKKCTWSKSSKSRAPSFFIAEAFLWKWRMVSCPNVGICWYLMVKWAHSGQVNRSYSSFTTHSNFEWYHYHKHIKYARDEWMSPSRLQVRTHAANRVQTSDKN